MQKQYTTPRLHLNDLTLNDAPFIQELVNTEGWLQFIGDRNVTSLQDAQAYVNRILENENVVYWVVKLKTNDTAIGIITFIKRSYLEYHDIGFAFLPEYTGRGYAFEAANMVLQDLLQNVSYPSILATTLPANTASIQLLERLGFYFEKIMETDGEQLLLYKFKK